MIVVNYAHPLTVAQHAQIEELTGQTIDQVLHVPAQFDHSRPFAEQIQALLKATNLSTDDWQTRPLLVNLPSFAAIAAVLLAELHGRMGYFPSIIRLRPVANSTPPQFEVAEVLNLNALRDEARRQR